MTPKIVHTNATQTTDTPIFWTGFKSFQYLSFLLRLLLAFKLAGWKSLVNVTLGELGYHSFAEELRGRGAMLLSDVMPGGR
eukprot:CAMPEP_0196147162 /NCGR_PEP_ID=MMETSP0910-20130528/24740_1 /TAXON_ID=49265 /ORGANISM="Thalassiosira rotula, Strain GSO102" /LENGTH=80 /DNA_ID=CAMNT_0041409517 /DNA_START=165 /DNA_END=407 /DNA_ORIENTATION=-